MNIYTLPVPNIRKETLTFALITDMLLPKYEFWNKNREESKIDLKVKMILRLGLITNEVNNFEL